jgi:CheY-like chemotaxis protein
MEIEQGANARGIGRHGIPATLAQSRVPWGFDEPAGEVHEVLWGDRRRFGDVEVPERVTLATQAGWPPTDPADEDRPVDDLSDGRATDGPGWADPLADFSLAPFSTPLPIEETEGTDAWAAAEAESLAVAAPLASAWDIPAGCLTSLIALGPSPATRILYLENDREHAAVVRRTLIGVGHRVTCCPDTNWLYPTLSSFDPDLVLIDLPRPETAISDLVRCLWNAGRSANLPVIFLSNDADVPFQAVRRIGAEVVVRPTDAGALLEIVQASLTRKRALEKLFSASV